MWTNAYIVYIYIRPVSSPIVYINIYVDDLTDGMQMVLTPKEIAPAVALENCSLTSRSEAGRTPIIEAIHHLFIYLA